MATWAAPEKRGPGADRAVHYVSGGNARRTACGMVRFDRPVREMPGFDAAGDFGAVDRDYDFPFHRCGRCADCWLEPARYAPRRGPRGHDLHVFRGD
jgi:hypothetical protein